MMQIEKQLLPTAFARAVNVDSTFAYMGSPMTFLAKGCEAQQALPKYRGSGVPFAESYHEYQTVNQSKDKEKDPDDEL
jgi:hypothetical protein